jgi:hypothetical protein
MKKSKSKYHDIDLSLIQSYMITENSIIAHYKERRDPKFQDYGTKVKSFERVREIDDPKKYHKIQGEMQVFLHLLEHELYKFNGDKRMAKSALKSIKEDKENAREIEKCTIFIDEGSYEKSKGWKMYLIPTDDFYLACKVIGKKEKMTLTEVVNAVREGDFYLCHHGELERIDIKGTKLNQKDRKFAQEEQKESEEF